MCDNESTCKLIYATISLNPGYTYITFNVKLSHSIRQNEKKHQDAQGGGFVFADSKRPHGVGSMAGIKLFNHKFDLCYPFISQIDCRTQNSWFYTNLFVLV